MKVVFAAEAESDLARIADRIASDSRARALTFLNDLRLCCENLALTPHAFPIVPRYQHLGIRRRVFEAYLIFYRVGVEQIDILHVLHGRRDVDVFLLPSKP